MQPSARYLGSITGSSLLTALLAGSAVGATNFAPILGLVIAAAVVATLCSLFLEDRPFSP
jgi:mannose/fructose/N-acetylgalactosamine-specific phosphotransferase system component IID